MEMQFPNRVPVIDDFRNYPIPKPLDWQFNDTSHYGNVGMVYSTAKECYVKGKIKEIKWSYIAAHDKTHGLGFIFMCVVVLSDVFETNEDGIEYSVKSGGDIWQTARICWFPKNIMSFPNPIAMGCIILSEDKSFLGLKDLPRGVRNNNPGNIKITGIGWRGKLPKSSNTDGVFEQFYLYKYGVRAMIMDLMTKIKRGSNTLAKIIPVYAPAIENNVEAYIASVEKTTGIKRSEVIGLGDKDKIQLIVSAMAKHENGMNCVSVKDFNEAWNLL